MCFEGLARARHESGDLAKARQEYENLTLLTAGRLRHGRIDLSLGSIPVLLGLVGPNIRPGVADPAP